MNIINTLRPWHLPMDFDTVVDLARALHEEGRPAASHSEEETRLLDEVYGRICSSTDSNPPHTLALHPSRKTVFVFGSDSVSSTILRQNGYQALRSLGFDHDYIYNDVVVLKHTSWLVLYTPAALRLANKSDNDNDRGFPTTTPATWDGVIQLTKNLFPDAFDDVLSNLSQLKSRELDSFQAEAGFDFYDAKKNEMGQFPEAPLYFSYTHFCSLPKPRKAWQVRAFLYCEMRLLKLFKGDGYTWTEQGERGHKEYIAPNVPLSKLDPASCAIIPVTVKVPDNV